MSGTLNQRGLPPATPTGAPSAVPSRLREHFDFVRRLGDGAMGEVWEARQRSADGRRVAVKMLHEHQTSSAVVVERLHREARALAAIDHPHVVKILDVVLREDGFPCLVQEYLDGESLRARMQRTGLMSVPDALDVMVPVLDALHAAHARSIFHRDIKPENILLARSELGRMMPYVIDFGVARMDTPGEFTLTTRSGSPGTPGYMAPEQIQHKRDEPLDARVDIWSAALVLWEMLAGRHPFTGGPTIAMLMRPCVEDVPRIERVVPGTSPSLSAVLARALTRDRTARIPSAAELIAALLEGHPWSSEPWCAGLHSCYCSSRG
jgi:serine/threonine-protein kinase